VTQLGTVYLLHFAAPGPGRARHYLGWTQDLGARLQRHLGKRGSRLLRAVVAAGGSWTLSRTWFHATRQLERALKQRHQHARLCPICRPAALARHAADERFRRHIRGVSGGPIDRGAMMESDSPPLLAPNGGT